MDCNVISAVTGRSFVINWKTKKWAATPNRQNVCLRHLHICGSRWCPL